MTFSDPVADMLTRLRNASVGYADETSMPSSKLKVNLAEVLAAEGYIRDYEVTQRKPQSTLTVRMKYGPERERVVQGIERVSKPGRRVYVKRDEIPRVRGGLGTAILSTNAGVMTDRQARRDGRGGEVLAYVW